MALWGDNDNITSTGIVTVNYSTGVVTGSGTTFGATGGGHTCARVGDIIRFGIRNGDDFGGISTYFGDAVIVSIASTTSLTIGSTANLSGGAIGATSYTISQCPKYLITDPSYSRNTGVGGTTDKFVYGISTSGSQNVAGTAFETGVGWVGIQTYKDCEGELRVKKEILVAMSGISTGNVPKFPDQK